MYLDYFGLQQKPFLITPDPVFLYPSAGHQQALAHLRYGLEREGGFLLLTGEVGTGKTTLCRLFMETLPDDFRLAYLLNTRLDSAGLLLSLCRELEIPVTEERDVNTLVEKIYDNLLLAHAGNKHTLVVIEEAQNLCDDVLETLRLLTNLETSTTKLLHILLIGQPELLVTLARSGLRQLNQRVVARAHLGPLARREMVPYFQHRLKMAGTDRPLFTSSAIACIYRKTGGIPRLVNLLAEHCLTGAYALGEPQVKAGMVRQAAREILAALRRPVMKSRLLGKVITPVVVAGVVILFVFALQQRQHITTLEPPAGSLPAEGGLSIPRGIEGTGSVDSLSPRLQEGKGTFLDVTAEKDSESTVNDSVHSQTGPMRPSAFEQLLSASGVSGTASSEKEMCVAAENSNLRCAHRRIREPSDVLASKYPILIRLFNDRDGIDIFFVENVSAEEVVLANGSGELSLPVESMLEKMDEVVLFLWRPPAGYSGPLVPGDANPDLVADLIDWLSVSGFLQETPITGGVYSEYLVARVREFQAANNLDVDGILGEQTLIRLAEYARGPDHLGQGGD